MEDLRDCNATLLLELCFHGGVLLFALIEVKWCLRFFVKAVVSSLLSKSPVNAELPRNLGKDQLKVPFHGSLGSPFPVCGCGYTAELG